MNTGPKPLQDAAKLIGLIMVLVGGALTAVAIKDFLAAFSTSAMPTKFWMAFVGLPLFGIGLTILKFASLGIIARYVAQETAPVGKDVANYMMKETKDSARDYAQAIGEGKRGEPEQATVQCPACHHPNDPDARFCDQCGTKLQTTIVCHECGKENEADAKFCDGCGEPLYAP